MSKEKWKPIKGFENRYEISNLGRIISKERIVTTSNGVTRKYKARFLKLKPNKSRGYVAVRLYHNNKVFLQIEVHRLVALHFLPNPRNLPIVNHIDTNRSNNLFTNLEWVSHRDNILHKGAHKKGREKSKKKVYQYSKDGFFLKAWSSATDASEYGFDRSGIAQTCTGHKQFYRGFIWKYE